MSPTVHASEFICLCASPLHQNRFSRIRFRDRTFSYWVLVTSSLTVAYCSWNSIKTTRPPRPLWWEFKNKAKRLPVDVEWTQIALKTQTTWNETAADIASATAKINEVTQFIRICFLCLQFYTRRAVRLVWACVTVCVCVGLMSVLASMRHFGLMHCNIVGDTTTNRHFVISPCKCARTRDAKWTLFRVCSRCCYCIAHDDKLFYYLLLFSHTFIGNVNACIPTLHGTSSFAQPFSNDIDILFRSMHWCTSWGESCAATK